MEVKLGIDALKFSVHVLMVVSCGPLVVMFSLNEL